MRGVTLRQAATPVCLAAALCIASTAIAAGGPGTLDRSFGAHGKVLTGFRHGKSHPKLFSRPRANAVVIDSKGRIVAVGSAARQFAVARYRPNGHLDRSFSGNGKTKTIVSAGHILRFGDAHAAAIDSKDRIIAAGRATVHGGENRFALVRYEPDGHVDRSFGDDGVVRTGFGQLDGFARAVALDPSGRIVAAGLTGSGEFALSRYMPSGKLDGSFGNGDGKVITTFSDGSDAVESIAIDASGRIVAGGYTQPRRKNPDFALARYQPDGSLDPSFGNGGRVVTNLGGRDDATSIARDSQGRIVAVGEAGKGDTSQFALARYLSDGSLDLSFGDGGKVLTQFAADSSLSGVAIDEHGRIVVVGHARSGERRTSPKEFAVARYMPNGDLNAGFSHDGKVISRFFGGRRPQGANGVAIDPKQRIVAAGYAGGKFALTRYLGQRP